MKDFIFYVDQKVTVWERTTYQVSAETYEEALGVANRLFDDPSCLEELDNVHNDTETLLDTMVSIDPIQNWRDPTKELISRNWFNNKREEITIRTNVV